MGQSNFNERDMCFEKKELGIAKKSQGEISYTVIYRESTPAKDWKNETCKPNGSDLTNQAVM